MNVLGINWGAHDSSVALMSDDRLVFAAEEERFSRIKHDGRFPLLSARAALDHAGIGFDDLDAVAFGSNGAPAYGLQDLRALLAGKIRFTLANLALPLGVTVVQTYMRNGRRPLRGLGSSTSVKTLNVDHHEAHAWSTYALSGFDEALVLVIDGRGAKQATTLYHARDEHLKPVKVINFPNSLGLFYAAFTDLLGFKRFSHEWKVMGLAAYGEPTDDLRETIRIEPSGYWVNGRSFGSPYLSDLSQLIKHYGPRRDPERLTQADRNLAASVQDALERAVLGLVEEGVRLTGCRNLCLAGGVALNSKANGRIAESGLVHEVFIQPAATDDGTAIGAAIAAHAALGRRLPRYRLSDVYLGPEYSQADITSAVETSKLAAVRVHNVEEIVAGLLEQGQIVGWFQGRMEFGPRALGNRSILADPRRGEMKDLVNSCVKFREAWRPFAPSCLAEDVDEYFESRFHSPFMLMTMNVRPAKRDVIPAVTHVDNTSRVQSVTREANPRYWCLIREFARLTGVPVVMNTSFNLRGEPIVCTPQNAIRTFYSSGLDFLVLGDFVLAKDPNWRAPSK